MLPCCSAVGQACLFSLKFCCLFFVKQTLTAMCILEFFFGKSKSLICSFHIPCNPALLEPRDIKEKNTHFCSNLTLFSLNLKKYSDNLI